MKILAASDIHSDTILVNKLAEKAEQEKVDLVVLCGDLTQAEQSTEGIIGPFIAKNKKVLLRNPNSTRPWQHVLEAVGGYLKLAVCLKNNKVHIDISNYGKHSRNIDKLKSVFEDENINYSSKAPIWTDSGRILPFQQRTEAETIELFDNCCTNEVYTLLHGKFYHCPFSANADNLKAIPHNENDFIDITNYKNINELRNRINDFQKKIKYPGTKQE